MRERTCLFLAVMIVAVLGAAVPAVADEHVGITGRDGGGNPPTGCPDCPASDPDCCKSEGNPTVVTPGIVVGDCDPAHGEGGWTTFYNCVQDAVVNGSTYEASPIVLDPDGSTTGLTISSDTIECVGLAEGVPEIGMVELTHSASGKVARIAKFVYGPGSGGVPVVHVELNARSFTISTSGLTIEQLNANVFRAINTRFVIEDHGDYWIVVQDRQTSASITLVSVRAEDLSLQHLDLELRSADPQGNYDTPCGQ